MDYFNYFTNTNSTFKCPFSTVTTVLSCINNFNSYLFNGVWIIIANKDLVHKQNYTHNYSNT